MNFLLMDWYKAAIRPILIWSLTLPSDRDPQARKKRRAIISSFLSGGLAGGTVTTVLYPVEFIRTRLAMDVGRGTVDVPRLYPGGMRDVCSSIWKVDGWRGFYQGYGIALAGVVLYRAFHLGGYDAVKTEILHRRGHDIGISIFVVHLKSVHVIRISIFVKHCLRHCKERKKVCRTRTRTQAERDTKRCSC